LISWIRYLKLRLASPGKERICIVTRTFIDTNIYVYALDTADPKKNSIARREIDRLTDSGEAVLSTQVLQEFYTVATRKLGHEPLKAKMLVQEMAENELVILDLPIIQAAVDIPLINGISFWDGLLLSAADVANCSILLTEDLQHGSRLAGMNVINPFL
jgi:predicted nucleic acid-binding protein